ncbi:hypothetical protein SKAU_G00279110 [Synaphobranchus kaupii]|uniref:Uncharacterized protein n=1 Tax=Synaphobranchus kaupii TaxID=118154 RepID=A0A9Q1INT3_SYNKA|nr:hypothetical protein SKAU_G00279110 [Synaphobranchus kaupii]
MADEQAAAAPAPQEITLGLQLVPPGNFDFNNASEWPRWIRRFERFRIASGLDRKDQAFQVQFKLDIGAAVTAIPSSNFSAVKHGPLQASHKVLYGPENNVLDVKGCFKGKLNIREKFTEQEIYVVSGLSRALLGLPAIEALQLIHRLHTVQVGQEDFRASYPAVFKGLGKLKEPYRIELEPGAVPFALSSPRRVPIPLHDKVKAELDRMEGMGFISKVTQPTAWCAGIVVVPKAQGKIRLCVDPTQLNRWVCRERHLLPVVDFKLAMFTDEGFHEIGCHIWVLAGPAG